MIPRKLLKKATAGISQDTFWKPRRWQGLYSDHCPKAPVIILDWDDTSETQGIQSDKHTALLDYVGLFGVE